ncbi:uncharacterized protein LOC144447266 isoform X2 [Glandiceps talaboti]
MANPKKPGQFPTISGSSYSLKNPYLVEEDIKYQTPYAVQQQLYNRKVCRYICLFLILIVISVVMFFSIIYFTKEEVSAETTTAKTGSNSTVGSKSTISPSPTTATGGGAPSSDSPTTAAAANPTTDGGGAPSSDSPTTAAAANPTTDGPTTVVSTVTAVIP